MPAEFRIESRWPSWAKWRIVTARPHDERFTFDSRGLLFTDLSEARRALEQIRAANEGDYRIIEIVSGPSITEARNMGVSL